MRLLLFAVALVAGGAAYWLWLTQAALIPAPAALSVSAPSVRVLVAAQDIAAGAVVAKGDVAWADFPAANLVAGMSVQGAQPDADQRILGTKALTAYAAGAPILRATLDGEAGLKLADLVAADKRAFAIVVSEASAVGGLVQPGDRIDLIQTRTAQGTVTAEIIASDLLVLAVDQRLAPETDAPPARTLTVELTLDDLPKISAASVLGGLVVALRSDAPKAAQPGQ